MPECLLEQVATVDLPAVARFSAKEKIQIGEVDGVKIGYLSDNFRQAFHTGDGKVETDVPEVGLRIHKLRKASLDTPIIEELGGEQVAETTLAHMWELLKKQGHGESGDLLTNGYANIFYICDEGARLWAVSCDWDASRGYWWVDACSVALPGEWNADSRVFSRDPQVL